MVTITLFLENEHATINIANKIATYLAPGLIITFRGEIGAGKTTFVRAMLRALGIQSAIKSPTYSIVESYSLEHWQIHHFDLYRIHDEMELDYIGFNDFFTESAICCIEWPEHAPHKLREIDLQCTLDFKESGRELQLFASTSAGIQLLNQFQSGL